ncbi:MAG: Rha family transcriptional regulator [Prevotella sp.]|nr:Rha family transcriptional regulator [Prevotella sp.]
MKTNSISTQQTMTSLEIAELTGKNHFDLMRAIRKMEPAWEKVNGCKFALVEYQDKKGELRPCYQLTKTECLYIATKFNDEARAKLVLRWQELEREHIILGTDLRGFMNKDAAFINVESSVSLKESRVNLCQKILAAADEIIGEGLRQVNAPAEDTLTATQVAKTFNMTVWDFNHVLSDMGIQYRRYGHWNISDDLADRNLVRLRTHISYSLKGEKKVKVYMTWTLDGLRFLNSKLGYPNF